MIELRGGLDITGIRQAMSMSLLTLKPFSVGTGLLFEDPVSSSCLQVLRDAAGSMRLGRLDLEGGIAVFHPAKLKWGHFSFDAGPVLPVAEIALMLIPALSRQPYRSTLALNGVTHSHLAQTTDCIRESLLGLFEEYGMYSWFSLKRFGFYGSGGGNVDAKVYPLEKRVCANAGDFMKAELTGARVYIAKLPTDYAARQKEVLVEEARIPMEKIGIMEILEADGPGNFMQVYFDCGQVAMVLNETCPLFETDGSYIFDAGQAERFARVFAQRVYGFSAAPVLPDALARELVVCAAICGCDTTRLAASGAGGMMASDLAGSFL